MNYVWEKFENEVKELLLTEKIERQDILLNRPDRMENGNISFPCFSLAKARKKSPKIIADELVEKWKQGKRDWKYIQKAESVGGYINFFIRKENFFPELISELSESADNYGSFNVDLPKLVGVEFLEPNTNKPLSVGHARNAFLGWSVSRILEFSGNRVIKFNLFNDRGTHICKSMLAYQKWGNDRTPADEGIKGDHFVGKYYVLFGVEAEKNPKLEQEAQQMLHDWENGTESVVALWKKMNEWFYEGVEETLQAAGIKFDKVYYESDIYKEGKNIVLQSLEKKKCYRLDDGAVEIDLTNRGLDKKILLRKDGTAVYIVQDLFLAKKKFEDYNLDLSIYVVADEQKYHFEVLFNLLDIFDISDKEKNYHLSYGMVNLSGGKMSSRKGTVVRWDDLYLEMKELAKQEIDSRGENLSDDEKNFRAEKIALAAMKFKLINQDKDKVIIFDKKEAIRFEGETGPYLLYTYARINSILQKCHHDIFFCPEDIKEFNNQELNDLLFEIAFFYRKVEQAAMSYNPAVISKYCYVLCQSFNNFYHKHHVLAAENADLIRSRLQLLLIVRQVLKNGMGLLGIELLEKM